MPREISRRVAARQPRLPPGSPDRLPVPWLHTAEQRPRRCRPLLKPNLWDGGGSVVPAIRTIASRRATTLTIPPPHLADVRMAFHRPPRERLEDGVEFREED